MSELPPRLDDQTARPLERTQDAHEPRLARLFAPVDIAFLVYFRIIFAINMLVNLGEYVINDRIGTYFVQPSFNFKYYGFGWVEPWGWIEPLGINGMYIHFWAMLVLAVMIGFGALYRVSMALFFLGFTYIFLLDKAYYQNHYYLIILVSGIMIFLPAHGALSVDAWLRPKLHRYTVPAWMLWLLRAQLGIAYFYGGLAKLNSDWLHGEPVRTWIVYGNLTEFGLDVSKEALVKLICYGGIVYDLSIVPLLLWRRTRLFAYIFSLFFHLTNSILFSIGIFPWFMIAATAIFFDPDWPRFGRKLRLETKSPEGGFRWTWGRRAVIGLLGLYLAVQLLVPFRHHLYPGDPGWTGDGDMFSWRMMLWSKVGTVRFLAYNPKNGENLELQYDKLLNRHQKNTMQRRPDMLLQFAYFLADRVRPHGLQDHEIRVEALLSFNGRRPQLQIDPEVDLAKVPRTLWGPRDWVLPLTEPLLLNPPAGDESDRRDEFDRRGELKQF